MENFDIEMWLDEFDKAPEIERGKWSGRLVTNLANRLPLFLLDKLQANALIPKKIRKIMFDVCSARRMIKKPDNALKRLFPDKTHDPVYGLEYFELFNKSSITLNRHTEAALGDVGNIRMFEATGMGSCLLTDHGNNILDIFVPDQEVLTYKTEDEAEEKLRYLLDNPAKVAEVAEAGFIRTMKDHTAFRRCEEISEHINSLF